MWSEFKKFAVKGNVLDLAVAVVIGVAFGAMVSSLVNDVILPPIGMLLGGVKFSELTITLQEAVIQNEEVVLEAIDIRYGAFIQTILDFIIIAFVIFMGVEGYNRMKRKEEAKPTPPEEPKGPSSEELLVEIRDLLRKS
nr:large-conductance mechanosensitive channel protein MscL [Saprospiraceae bacterium]